jgi:hypothetical protein
MATRTITVDDITGQEISGDVFKTTLAGKELELSEDTNEALQALASGDLATFHTWLYLMVKTAGRKSDAPDNEVVRKWALAQMTDKGVRRFPDLKERGRIPADVMSAYRLAFPAS